MPIKLNIAWAALLLICVGCSLGLGGDEKTDDRLLAKVHNKSLYLSELDGMFPEGTSAEDSSYIIDVFTQRWIRDAVVLHEAEQNIPSDLNIDKLVRDYRASLIRHQYEKILVEELLESEVREDDLVDFYEQNKQQYQLETPIVRSYLIKVPLPVPEASQLRQLWNSNQPEDFEALVNYCNEHAETHLLAEQEWYKVEDIALELPKGTVTVDNISEGLDFSRKDEDYQYYFKVLEVKKRQDIAPLSYIKEQARKVILRNRKEELLEQKIEAMYNREFRRNNIQTYYKQQ
jgi:hypothetical protein